MIRKNVGLIAIVGLFAFSMAYVYAYEVDLPRPDFLSEKCYAVMWDGSTDWEFTCTWGYGESFNITYPRDGTIIPLDSTSKTPIEDINKEIELFLEEQIRLSEEDDVDVVVEDEPPRPLETIDPEVRRALDKLGECQFGEGKWAAIVSNYTREVPDELPIFTSGLDKRNILGALARNFEECRGMTEYPWLSAEYENKYLADILGLDYLGRTTDSRGNQPSLMFEMTSGVSTEEKTAEADKWKKWMCAEENLHLKLCGHEFRGINQGGFNLDAQGNIVGAKCQLQGQPATEGGTASQERCPLRSLESYGRTELTQQELFSAINEAICDEYAKSYEYLAIDKRPNWLIDCYDE